MRFLDTNVLLRYLTRDDEGKAQRAFALIARLEEGRERVRTSPMVVFEAVFTLEKSYRTPRPTIRDSMRAILSLRGLELARKELFHDALDLYAATSLSFADAYNAAFMRREGIDEIYSWDEDFDHVSGIDRVEPEG